jgi:ATP-dependent RNA helicase DDX19/DBP5
MATPSTSGNGTIENKNEDNTLNNIEQVVKEINIKDTETDEPFIPPPRKEGEEDGLDPSDEASRVEVLQSDPNTPYSSVSTFEELGLSKELLQGVYAMKYNKPSRIQATSLPLIAKDPPKNLIGQAKNGSGKTACFVLGMLMKVNTKVEEVQALCVVPTRELARQILSVLETMGKYTGVKVYCAVKQTEEERNVRQSIIRDHIIVGTPGRVMDLIKRRLFNPATVKIFVLDEADVMVDTQGMGDQTLRIKRALSPQVQTLLFSATFSEQVQALAQRVAPNASQIAVKREELNLDNVQQYYFMCEGADKRFDLLSDIYGCLTIGQSIIFVHTRASANELTKRLREEGHTVSLLHGGDMSPEERDRVIDEFRRGTTKVLVTTNVLARGVDVLQVTVVVNYDLPLDVNNQPDPETYLHRVGRTGRFGRKGLAINFVYDRYSLKQLQDIEKYLGNCHIEKVNSVEELEKKIKHI